MKSFFDPGPSNLSKLTTNLLGRSLLRSSLLRSKFKELGDISDLISWRKERFGDSSMSLFDRETLWEKMTQEIFHEYVHIFEFGVAAGYATNWWVSNLNSKGVQFSYYGFDRFVGLPRAWRGHKQGTFDAGGRPPQIEDSRITWMVGEIDQTISSINWASIREHQKIFLFDLDLFEPSLSCWNQIKSVLISGDILYFDEAYDSDERHLINFHVLPQVSTQLLGSSPMAVALTIRGQ